MKRHIAYVIAILVAATHLCAANDLDDLKAKYTEAKQQINLRHTKTSDTCAQAYSSGLTTLEDRFKKSGNLEALLAIRKEIDRFAETKEIPATVETGLSAEVILLRQAHIKALQEASRERDKNHAQLLQQYVPALDGLKKRLTTEDKIADALLVQEEQKDAETSLAFFQDSQSRSAPAVKNQSTPPPAAPSKGLFLHFTFDKERANQITDRSGKRHHGIAHEAESHNDPTRGAVFFADAHAYVEVRNSPSLTPESLTVSAWVKPSGNRGAIVDKHDWDNGNSPKGYVLRLSNMKANFTIGNGKWYGISSASDLPRDEWTHLVASFDGSTARLYVNGKEEGSTRVPAAMVPSKYPLRVGHGTFDKGASRKYEGLIDEVMVFDRALSSDEIQHVFTGTRLKEK